MRCGWVEVYFAFKKLVGALFMPFPVFLVLFVTGLGLLLAARRRAGLVVIWGSLVFLLALSSPLSDRWLAMLEDRYPPLADITDFQGIDAVVVLGGGWSPEPGWPISSQLTVSSAIRLMEGVRLAVAFPEARLIVSGGSSDPDRRDPLAHVLAKGAQELGIPEDRIVIIDTPLDTADEARAMADLLGPEPDFLLVTTAAHMPRAMAHFHHVGLEPIPGPTQRRTMTTLQRSNWMSWVPSPDNLGKAGVAWYEFLGLLALELDH